MGQEHRSSNSNSGSLIKYQPRHQVDDQMPMKKKYKTPYQSSIQGDTKLKKFHKLK